MCDPVSGAMAFMSVMQVQQQQQAAVEEANAVNDAFRENNEMQVDAYNKDMEAFWDEEVNIQEEMYDNAEDAAQAGLDMKVQHKSDVSSMLIANAETTAGGGGTPQALLGNLRRSQLNSAMDLDENFQRGVVALGGEIAGLQRDKVARRNQAIGAINGAPRASYQSQQSKMLALGMAGGSAFVQGQAMQGNNLFGSTSPVKPKQVGTGDQHGRTTLRAPTSPRQVVANNFKDTSGWDWKQRNPGKLGRGETAYTKWGFGGDMKTAKNYRKI